MPRSRTQAWLRDELILALDLYRQHGRHVPRAELEALSLLLRTMPVERELAHDPTFRNPNAVQLKIYNFVAIDPNAETEGMSRGGRRDQAAWDAFAGDEDRLKVAAEAIRANLRMIAPADADVDEEDIADAPEGRILTRIHRVRERNCALVEKKKQQVLNAEGRLACEGCGFDFAFTYGEHGKGFIECHHTIPVATLRPGSRTKMVDLALVCANCHRMIHRHSQWLTIRELQAITSDGDRTEFVLPRRSL
jgi:5-methylcytosine-specific restriction protein A